MSKEFKIKTCAACGRGMLGQPAAMVMSEEGYERLKKGEVVNTKELELRYLCFDHAPNPYA